MTRVKIDGVTVAVVPKEATEAMCASTTGTKAPADTFAVMVMAADPALTEALVDLVKASTNAAHALILSGVASCTCNTKTLDPQYHDEDCFYRTRVSAAVALEVVLARVTAGESSDER